MDKNEMRFSPKGNKAYVQIAYVNIPWVVIVVLIVIGNRLSKSFAGSVVMYLIFTVFLGFTVYAGYMAFNAWKNKSADIVINSEEIIIPVGYSGKSRAIAIHDIKDINVPKWDKYITITDCANERIVIALSCFDKTKLQMLKDIFISLNPKKTEEMSSDNNSKSNLVVNGKMYTR